MDCRSSQQVIRGGFSGPHRFPLSPPPPSPQTYLSPRNTGQPRCPPLQPPHENLLSLPYPGSRPIVKQEPAKRDSTLLPPGHNDWEALRFNAFRSSYAGRFQCLLVVLVFLLVDIGIDKNVLLRLFESQGARSTERYAILACVCGLAKNPHKMNVSQFTAEEWQNFVSPIADLRREEFRSHDLHSPSAAFTRMGLRYDLDMVLELRFPLCRILPLECVTNLESPNHATPHDHQLQHEMVEVERILGNGVECYFIYIIALTRCRRDNLQNWCQTVQADGLVRFTTLKFRQASRYQRTAYLLVSYVAHMCLFGPLSPYPGEDKLQPYLPDHIHREGYKSISEALASYIELSEDGYKIKKLLPEVKLPRLTLDRVQQWKLVVGDRHYEICRPSIEPPNPPTTEEKKSAIVLLGAFSPYTTFEDHLRRYFDVDSVSTTDISREIIQKLAKKKVLALFYYDGQSTVIRDSIEDTMNAMRCLAQANGKKLTTILVTDQYRIAQPYCEAQRIVNNTSCQHLQLSLDRDVQLQVVAACLRWIHSPPQQPGTESKIDAHEIIPRSTRSQKNNGWWRYWIGLRLTCVRRVSE